MKNNYTITRLDKVRIKKILKKSEQDYPELSDRVESASVIDAIDVPNDLVTMNCRIRCQDPETKSITEITLVYPRYADEEIGNVSILSNAGIALFAANVGQTIEYQSSEGNIVSLYIVEILYQPEHAGHYLI
tara:strand:- start:19609 stop:20004 length:396 start_codon:yes stop_codon:yes gene_type:complete